MNLQVKMILIIKNLIFIFLFINFSVFNVNCYVDDDDEYVGNKVKEEIKKQLSDLKAEKNKEQEEINKKIKTQVKKEVETQVFREKKNYIKDKVYGNIKPSRFVKDDYFIYKLPTWPFYSIPFMQKDLFQLDLAFTFATQAYSSSGGTQDLSKLIFSDSNIEIEDIFLVSKLVKDNKLAVQLLIGGKSIIDETANANHYFSILSDQPLVFDASTETQQFSINYARHFHKGDIAFGFQIPFVRRKNKLKLTSQISTSKHQELVDAAIEYPDFDFYAKYDDLEDYFEAILSAKDINFDQTDTEVGIGDISTFLNFEFDWKRAERFLTGLQIVFPTARERNTYQLWQPELDGGFAQLCLFGSLLFSVNRFLNPHVFAKASCFLPATVNRRVPKFNSYDGIDPVPGNKVDANMIFGEYVYYAKDSDENPLTFTNELGASVKRFSDANQKVKISPGPQIMLRIGNIFERFLLKNGFLDIFYDIRIKGKDYHGSKHNDEYDYTIINENTYQIENRIGLTGSYQFDDNFRLSLGGQYSFAGRNIPRTFKIDMALNIEF